MAIFGDYARYYNLLYRDKDYAGETDFVLGTLHRAGTTPQSLLDLGCGTGRHALEMATRGLAVTGVDMGIGRLIGRKGLAKIIALVELLVADPAVGRSPGLVEGLGKGFFGHILPDGPGLGIIPPPGALQHGRGAGRF